MKMKQKKILWKKNLKWQTQKNWGNNFYLMLEKGGGSNCPFILQNKKILGKDSSNAVADIYDIIVIYHNLVD